MGLKPDCAIQLTMDEFMAVVEIFLKKSGINVKKVKMPDIDYYENGAEETPTLLLMYANLK